MKHLLLIAALLASILFLSGSVASAQDTSKAIANSKSDMMNVSDFVGSETCSTCHAGIATRFSSNPHSKLALMHGGKGVTCESCHGGGRAHVESGGDPTKILQIDKASSKVVDSKCLGCHVSAHPNFERSPHGEAGVSCTNCHSVHGLAGAANPVDPSAAAAGVQSKPVLSARLMRVLKPDSSVLDPLQWSATALEVPGQNPNLLRASQPQLCYSCHTDVKSSFAQPFHHKVDEGLMKCSDCHDSHGTFQVKNLRTSADQNATCVKCHTETAGPFVYEHPVVKTDGCVSCHSPHGSPNARLLNIANVNTMCLQCHSSINLASFPNTPSEQGGPVHNQATQYVACTNCHSQIHGSNAAYNFFR